MLVLDEMFLKLDELDLEIAQRLLVSFVTVVPATRLFDFEILAQEFSGIFRSQETVVYLNISGHSRQHLFHTMM